MRVFVESNRWKHFILAIPIGMILTILCVIGVAFGMEFKDYQYGGKWDWIDLGFTLLGGAVGQVIQVLILLLII